MDKQQLLILGTIVTLVGCLTILLNWLEIYYEDYYGSLYFSYTGVSLVASGDFTNPEGIFYGSVGILGVYTPTLICIAFACMALRFVVKIENRPYLKDVLVSTILILIGSIYMIYWVNPGTFYDPYYTEIHEFGAGPFVSIVVALVGAILAYNLDHTDSKSTYTASQPTYASVPTEENTPVQASQEHVMFCPMCGHGLTQQDTVGSKFCRYCGANIEQYTDKQNDY